MSNCICECECRMFLVDEFDGPDATICFECNNGEHFEGFNYHDE